MWYVSQCHSQGRGFHQWQIVLRAPMTLMQGQRAALRYEPLYTLVKTTPFVVDVPMASQQSIAMDVSQADEDRV